MEHSLILTLTCRDLEVTESFYRDLLGMQPERLSPLPRHPPLLALKWGDTTVLFREVAVQQTLHPALFADLDRHPFGIGVSLAWQLKDLEPVRRNLERRGWPLVYELEDRQFERTEIWIHDPDGYLLMLSEEPG